MSTNMICERCQKSPVTTRQEYRETSDDPTWANKRTMRCDGCAELLRGYVAMVPGFELVRDERATPKYRARCTHCSYVGRSFDKREDAENDGDEHELAMGSVEPIHVHHRTTVPEIA